MSGTPTPASWRTPCEIIELILLQVIGTKHLDPVCTSSRFFEFLEKDNRRDFDEAEWHRRRLRCVCREWKRFLDGEGSRVVSGRLGLDNSPETMEKTRRARRVQYEASLYNWLVQPTQWETFCSSVVSEAAHLETLASHIHLHPRLRRLHVSVQRSTQSSLCQQLTIALLSNITFLFVKMGFGDRPIMTFKEGPITLPALQTLIWSTYFDYADPFPVTVLDLPSLRHLSLKYDPACAQLLEIGDKYPKLVSFHVAAATDKYAPLRFPSLGHFPRLEELSLNKPFDPNIPTLLPQYHPLQRLYLRQSSVNDLVKLVHRILRESPKHLRLISVDDTWFPYLYGYKGIVSLGSYRALAAESEAKNIRLHDCRGLDLLTMLKEM